MNGDFCARHWKRPQRYTPFMGNTYITRQYINNIRKIQTWWRKLHAFLSFARQGPAMHLRAISQNETEIYSLESIQKIPQAFFFSYADSQRCVWSFDIRSLVALMSQGHTLTNPYTREPISQQTLGRIRNQISYLRSRKYPLVYFTGVLTDEQIWNQKVLDVFMKLESLGYLCSCEWFTNLNVDEHKNFYRLLFQLWQWRLGLSATEKEEIVPHHTRQSSRIFKSCPDALIATDHDLRWWQKHNLTLINAFVSRSEDKTKQALGSLYVLMAFVQVSEDAAEAYPWILETVS